MNTKGVSTGSDNSVKLQAWNVVLGLLPPEHQFLSHHWFDVWSCTYAAKHKDIVPVIYSSSNEGNIASQNKKSFFPCVLRTISGLQVLSIAGYYYPFRSFLCHPDVQDTAIDSFADMIHTETKATILHFGPLQATDQIIAPLEVSFKRKHWRICKVSVGTQQVMILPTTVEAFRDSLSRNLRKNHDRRKKSLTKLGQSDITYYNDCSEEVWNRVIDCCADIEMRSWLANDGEAKSRVYGHESFWKNYAATIEGSKRLSAWVVTLDSKAIAYSLAIDSGSCRYSISGQYDEAYKKYGVGIIADMSMFEQALESGLHSVNLGDGESDYKRRWGAKPGSELQFLYLFRPGTLGWLAHTAFRALEWMRHSSLFHRLNRYF